MKAVYLLLSLLWIHCAIMDSVSAQGARTPYRSSGTGVAPSNSGQGSSPSTGSRSGSGSGSGGQAMVDLLQVFDDYLLDNLEQTYYRLSYAFKDAAKKTLDNCRCTKP